MSILVSTFSNPEEGSQAYNAISKALNENPKVAFIGEVEGRRYFEVTSTRKLGPKYPVRVWEDEDRDFQDIQGHTYVSEHGQFWIECFCKGATPPLDNATKVIAWFPKVCYHMAAVLIFASQECGFKEDEDALPLE